MNRYSHRRAWAAIAVLAVFCWWGLISFAGWLQGLQAQVAA